MHDLPLPESSGAGGPPVRRPPTALATLQPDPPPRPEVGWRVPSRGVFERLRQAVEAALDVADDVAARLRDRLTGR